MSRETEPGASKPFPTTLIRVQPASAAERAKLAPAMIERIESIAAGFRPARGQTALFAGPSGTGKTMAAQVLAAALGRELYRVDLAAVASKYIGETEKNLSRLFEAAADQGVIVFFDEADGLFGKRSEVRDAHDRYANIEVAYLLQRLEDYEGLAILTTNSVDAIDPGFVRRRRNLLEFPAPRPRKRRGFWHRLLALLGIN